MKAGRRHQRSTHQMDILGKFTLTRSHLMHQTQKPARLFWQEISYFAARC
jgi:hypothetical protein